MQAWAKGTTLRRADFIRRRVPRQHTVRVMHLPLLSNCVPTKGEVGGNRLNAIPLNLLL
jgi:hypothetical protein